MAGPLLQRGRPACPSAGIWATCSSTSESFRIAITSPHPINTFPVFGSLSEHKTTRLQKYLFGFRGSAVTPSERRGHVCVACNGLCSRLMGGGKCPFQSSTQLLGMGIPIGAPQDGTEQFCSMIPKREVCYNPSCLQRCSSKRQRS